MGEGVGDAALAERAGLVSGAGEVPVSLLPTSMILARRRWSVPMCIPPPAWWQREQRGSAPSAAELRHGYSPIPSLARSAQTTLTAGAHLFFYLFIYFISHKNGVGSSLPWKPAALVIRSLIHWM